MLVEGLPDSLEYLLDLEGRKRLQGPISHRFAEGLELHFADEPGENGVAAAGVVVAKYGVGSSGRHVENENARRCRAVRCCSEVGVQMEAKGVESEKNVVRCDASEAEVQMKAESC